LTKKATNQGHNSTINFDGPRDGSNGSRDEVNYQMMLYNPQCQMDPKRLADRKISEAICHRHHARIVVGLLQIERYRLRGAYQDLCRGAKTTPQAACIAMMSPKESCGYYFSNHHTCFLVSRSDLL
jgi:hypothetical protein